MSQIKTLNGVQYTLPQYNDTGWGANTGNVLTQYMAAIADVTLQLSGGAFTLTADVNFGASFGLVSSYFTSRTSTPATAGAVRLAKTDVVSWRNNANGANIDLSKDTSDNLKWNATKILLSGAVVNADINAAAAIAYSKLALTGSIVNADLVAGTLTNTAINASAAIAYSKLALTGSIVNGDLVAGTILNTAINASAAIARTKLAALTISRAMVTDGSGFDAVSATTATELGYVSGVTSAIQTQLNAKLGAAAYRRPVLSFISTTVVGMETGIDGTSGDAQILFPDGSLRTDSDTTRIRMTISQNAVFNNATRANNIGGLRTGAVAANTWYACYAVKVTAGSGASTDMVLVADVVLPTQANFATLNSNFGTNGWVYLGLIRYGDGNAATTVILKFTQTGNMTTFRNLDSGVQYGLLLASIQASASTSVTYTYAAGTGAAQIPDNITNCSWGVHVQSSSGSSQSNLSAQFAGTSTYYCAMLGKTSDVLGTQINGVPNDGVLLNVANTAGTNYAYIFFQRFWDAALGVGASPQI